MTLTATQEDRLQADRQKKYEFKTQPWEHQKEALLASWNKKYFALLCDYGTGKSKIIIDTIGINYERNNLEALFVIAPNEVHERWISEQIPAHLPDRIKYIARVWTGSTSQKFKRSLEQFWHSQYRDHLKIFTMNVEALQSSKRGREFAKNFLAAFRALLAIDESTRIKTPSAKRTKFIINNLSKLAIYRRTLTGNEVTRSPFDVYCPYRFLKPDFWYPIANYHIFKHRYGKYVTRYTYRKTLNYKKKCPKCKTFIEKLTVKKWRAVCPKCFAVVKKLEEDEQKRNYETLISYKRLDELRAKTIQHSYLIRKEDCMDLPPKIYQPIYAEMNDEQTRVYKELKNELCTQYKGVELSVINKIALSTRFQQIVGGFFPTSEETIGDSNPKIERLLYDLEDIDCADPIIIWSRFTAELKAIARNLRKNYDKPVALYYGGTAKADRKQIVDEFQAGKYAFFVANPQTAGTGLNLQRAYIHYYYSNSFNAEDRWQSEDRSHRGGQTNQCLYKDIYIKGTVDDTIKKANQEKKDLADFFRTRSLEDIL